MNVSGERVIGTGQSFEEFAKGLEKSRVAVNLFPYELMRERVMWLLSMSSASRDPGTKLKKLGYNSLCFGLPYWVAKSLVLENNFLVAQRIEYFPRVTGGVDGIKWRSAWQPLRVFGLYGRIFRQDLVGVTVTRYVNRREVPVDVYDVMDSYVSPKPRKVVGGTGWGETFQGFVALGLGLSY